MKALLRAALRPWEAFPLGTGSPGRAFGVMLAWRLPLGLADALLGWWGLGHAVSRLRGFGEPLLQDLWRRQGGEAADLRAALADLPALPGLDRAWPWLVLAAPVGLLGLWLHHAVWDHGCLWLLRGVDRTRGFRTTFRAESEALTVGSLGVLLGLLGHLPGLGLVLGLPLGLIGLWFWGLRGFALAAHHGCPIWKGVAATGLHLLLVGCCACGLLGLLGLMVSAGAGAP